MYGGRRDRFDSLTSSGSDEVSDMCAVWEDFAANGRDMDGDFCTGPSKFCFSVLH